MSSKLPMPLIPSPSPSYLLSNPNPEPLREAETTEAHEESTCGEVVDVRQEKNRQQSLMLSLLASHTSTLISQVVTPAKPQSTVNTVEALESIDQREIGKYELLTQSNAKSPDNNNSTTGSKSLGDRVGDLNKSCVDPTFDNTATASISALAMDNKSPASKIPNPLGAGSAFHWAPGASPKASKLNPTAASFSSHQQPKASEGNLGDAKPLAQNIEPPRTPPNKIMSRPWDQGRRMSQGSDTSQSSDEDASRQRASAVDMLLGPEINSGAKSTDNAQPSSSAEFGPNLPAGMLPRAWNGMSFAQPTANMQPGASGMAGMQPMAHTQQRSNTITGPQYTKPAMTNNLTSPSTTETSGSSSSWATSRNREIHQFQRIDKLLNHSGYGKSPATPKSFDQWVNFKADSALDKQSALLHDLELKEKAKTKARVEPWLSADVLASKFNQETVAKEMAGGGDGNKVKVMPAFGGKQFGHEGSAVLFESTAWTPPNKKSDRPANTDIAWPDPEEFRYASQTHGTGSKLPPPRYKRWDPAIRANLEAKGTFNEKAEPKWYQREVVGLNTFDGVVVSEQGEADRVPDQRKFKSNVAGDLL